MPANPQAAPCGAVKSKNEMAGPTKSKKTKNETAETTAEQRPDLPLFYRDPRPLNSDRHASKAIKTEPDFSFAAATNSVPVTAMEFTRIARHYPIVFTSGDPVAPVAVLGLRNDQNAFISTKGDWAKGCYIPAYVRRYPFILMESPDRLQYTLCIDEASELLVEGDERALFDGDEPSEITKGALKFCSAYQGEHAFTLEFTAALEKYGLLVDNRADVSLESGEKLALGGFRMVEEAKFTALPDDVFLDWRQRGWVPLVYCHLLSMGNWQALAERTDE